MGAARSAVAGDQKYRRGYTCPICGGSEDDDRGTGKRCFGFISSDGKFARCTREEYAGTVPEDKTGAFPHMLKGKCRCGVEHNPADPKPTATKTAPRKKWRIVAEYDYVDEVGELLFQAVRRIEPGGAKDFMQRRPAAAGTWIYSLTGIRRVLYRLPELIAADPAAPVWIVEGEKDVDRLRSLGLVATCNPMGAGKWSDDYAPSLAGRTCHVVMDNDEKGRDHGDKVARSVVKVAAAVKLLDLVDLTRSAGLGELAEKGDASDYLDLGGTVEAMRRAFDEAPAWQPLKVHRADERPDIEISVEWHLARDAAVKALVTDDSLYNRGGQIVSIARETADEEKVTKRVQMRHLAGSPKIVAVSESNIGCALTKTARFFRWKKDKDGEEKAVDIPPTNQLVKSVATLKDWPGMRILDSIAECPFPRVDGSLVETPGYDAETRTFYAPSIPFLPVPARPTHADAVDAWLRISSLVADFPFAGEDDRVVFLAGLLTVIARPAIEGAVPGIAVVGNRAGTGKGLLIDAMVMPGTGRICPTSTYPETTEEATKVKVSIAKAAKVAVHFDNLENGSSYGGSTDSPLTTLETDDRHLGTNDAPSLKLRAAWFLSGNNLSPTKDAHRRWIVCRLHTDLENPEDRTDFENANLRPTVLEKRPEIVRDALTILRAHTLAGSPAPKWAAFGSYEDWDRVVRRAVWFATGRDCRTTQREVNAEAPERNENLALLEGLWEIPTAREGCRGVTAEKAVKLVAPTRGENGEEVPSKYEMLRLALIARGRNGYPADSRQLGNYLKALANNPIGEFRLVKHPLTIQRAIAWIVKRTPGKGESSESSESRLSASLQNFASDKDAIEWAYNTKNVLVGAIADSPDSLDSPDEDTGHGDAWEGDLPASFVDHTANILAGTYRRPTGYPGQLTND